MQISNINKFFVYDAGIAKERDLFFNNVNDFSRFLSDFVDPNNAPSKYLQYIWTTFCDGMLVSVGEWFQSASRDSAEFRFLSYERMGATIVFERKFNGLAITFDPLILDEFVKKHEGIVRPRVHGILLEIYLPQSENIIETKIKLEKAFLSNLAHIYHLRPDIAYPVELIMYRGGHREVDEYAIATKIPINNMSNISAFKKNPNLKDLLLSGLGLDFDNKCHIFLAPKGYDNLEFLKILAGEIEGILKSLEI